MFLSDCLLFLGAKPKKDQNERKEEKKTLQPFPCSPFPCTEFYRVSHRPNPFVEIVRPWFIEIKKKTFGFFFPRPPTWIAWVCLVLLLFFFFLTHFFLIFFIEIQKPKSQWRSDPVAATPMFRSSFVWKIPLIVARFLERPRPEAQKWSNNKNKRWNQKNNRRRPSKDVVVVETWTILCFGRNPSPRWHVIEKNPPTNEKETKSKGNPKKKKTTTTTSGPPATNQRARRHTGHQSEERIHTIQWTRSSFNQIGWL